MTNEQVQVKTPEKKKNSNEKYNKYLFFENKLNRFERKNTINSAPFQRQKVKFLFFRSSYKNYLLFFCLKKKPVSLLIIKEYFLRFLFGFFFFFLYFYLQLLTSATYFLVFYSVLSRFLTHSQYAIFKVFISFFNAQSTRQTSLLKNGLELN